MRIGAEQVNVLRAGIHRRLTDAVLVDVRAQLGEETASMTEEELRALVHRGVERAVSYQVRSQKDLVRYVGLMVRYGADLDADPSKRSVLLSRLLGPEGKLDVLERRLRRGAHPRRDEA